MPTLHVAFQEGFSDDEIVVRVNGIEVFRKSGVTTRLQIGYADSFELDIPSGEARLEVNVVTRNATTSRVLQVSDRRYVGVSLDRRGQLVCELSDQPFGYL